MRAVSFGLTKGPAPGAIGGRPDPRFYFAEQQADPPQQSQPTPLLAETSQVQIGQAQEVPQQAQPGLAAWALAPTATGPTPARMARTRAEANARMDRRIMIELLI